VSGKSIEDIEHHGVTKFENTQIRSIEINMLMNFIRKIVTFPKITISCLRGEVVTPFIGLSLAGDYRVMEEGSSYNFSHLKYAIHPSAALPFFLPLFVGQGKAMEILLTGGIFDTNKALALTLINKVIPSENFESLCIEEAKKICGINLQLIKTTKNLSNNFKTELDRFFEKESNFMLR
jgi:enoyl-CoA hydratase